MDPGQDDEQTDGEERLFTQAEVDEIVERRLAREQPPRAAPPRAAPAQQRRAAPPQPPHSRQSRGGDDVSSMIRDLVQLQVAQTLGAMRPAGPAGPAGPPVSGNGAPPPAPSLGVSEDTPLWKLSEDDLKHLVRTKGPAYIKDRYYKSLKHAKVKVRNY